MELAPGPSYLLRSFPYFAIPSTVVYVCLTLVKEHLGLVIPIWLRVLAVVFARPLMFIFNRYYSRFAERRDAAANNAIVAPHVRESVFSIIFKVSQCLKKGHPADFLLDWTKEYGNIYQLRLLNDNRMVTVEPFHIKAILATQSDAFEKGPTFQYQFKSLAGGGVVNADGEMWKFHRAMIRPFFTQERIRDFDVYDENCARTLRLARTRLAEGYPVEFQDLVSRLIIDSTTGFLLGRDVGSLSANIPYPASEAYLNKASFYNHPSTTFVKALTEGQNLTTERLRFGNLWPLFEFWSDKVAPFRRIIDNLIQPLIEGALTKRNHELSKGADTKVDDDEDDNLLAHLVKHTEDRNLLSDELNNVITAGRDTVTCLITFSFYMLSEHPNIETRLRQEIYDVVGETGRPTYDQMREMKYMRAFLNEVLRLYPPAPIIPRFTNKAVVLPALDSRSRSIYIPANTDCLLSFLIMHRRKDLWGPDALVFDPDRFLDQHVQKYLTPNPSIFCPFSAGPRICPGQQLAYHEATYFLVRLLQEFTGFSLDKSQNLQPPTEWACHSLKGTEDLQVYPGSHMTMYIKGGLWVRMEPLDSSE